MNHLTGFYHNSKIKSRVFLEYYEPFLHNIIEAVITDNLGFKKLIHPIPEILISNAYLDLEDGTKITNPEHICLQIHLGELSNAFEIIPNWNDERIKHLPLFIPHYTRTTIINL